MSKPSMQIFNIISILFPKFSKVSWFIEWFLWSLVFYEKTSTKEQTRKRFIIYFINQVSRIYRFFKKKKNHSSTFKTLFTYNYSPYSRVRKTLHLSKTNPDKRAFASPQKEKKPSKSKGKKITKAGKHRLYSLWKLPHLIYY